MRLLSPQSVTARGHDGVFVGPRGGISFVSAPPIEVFHFGLERDYPEWDAVDPRVIRLEPRQLRIELAQTRSAKHKLQVCSQAGEVSRAAGRYRDLRSLRQMIGLGLFRLISRMPLEARPYLLAWLSHRDRNFEQILRSAPMLAVLVANLPPSTPEVVGPDDLLLACREEVLMPRKEIVESRGFPPDAVRGLAKITPSGADPRLAGTLAAMLRDPAVRKRFNHARVVGPDAARFFSDERLLSRVTGRFLRLLCELDRRQLHAHFAPMLEASLVLIEMGECRGRHKIFTSPAGLQDWYHIMCVFAAPEDIERIRHCRFPEAPVKGIPGFIEQIRTGEGLLVHATDLFQCIAGDDYVDRLREKSCWLFRAQGFGLPVCTIEVEPVAEDVEGNKRYGITQVAGACNSRLSPQALAAIRVWAEDEGMEMRVQEQGRAL